MKIAVLSDTHIPVNAADLPKQVYDGIAGAELILHAGDLLDMEVFKKLSEIAPTKAVCGNMDSGAVAARLPKKDIIKINGLSIGLIHGWGPPFGLIELVKNEFKDNKVDAIVFGHSHTPVAEVKNGVLFFNPGSPTDKIFAPYNSYGILEIENGKITPRIIKI